MIEKGFVDVVLPKFTINTEKLFQYLDQLHLHRCLATEGGRCSNDPMLEIRHKPMQKLCCRGWLSLSSAIIFGVMGCATTDQPEPAGNPSHEEETAGSGNPLDPMNADDLDEMVEGMDAIQDLETGIVPIEGNSALPDQLPALGMEEDPDAFSDGFEQPVDSGFQLEDGIWWRSGADAIAKAQATHRPLLVWMANSKAGAIDRAINDEVFSTEEFREVMENRLVGLKIDYGDQDVMASDYYKNFRERYRPRGAPTLILLLPDGTEEVRYTGYKKNKGTPKGWVQRLEDDVSRAEKSFEDWMATLRANGYRDWHDKEGNAFFARALRLDRERKHVWLMGRYRNKYRVPLDRLNIGEREALLRATKKRD